MANFLYKGLEKLGSPFYWGIYGVGNFFIFTWETLRWLRCPPFRFSRLMIEFERIGFRSIPIIALVALFAGMVFALQIANGFRTFNAETLVGATVGLALTRELAPVFTALMIVSRCCSAMAAELGTMRVTDQIDALKSMAVNPVQFLVVPKVIATTLMAPLLTGLFNGVGILGSYLVSINLLQIPEGPYLERFRYIVDPEDMYQGLIKATIFGIFISLISCYRGYRAGHGAEGVGRATTQAVVISSVLVLVSDYFLTTWLLQLFPD